MIELGLRKNTYGAQNLIRQSWPALPTSFPDLPEGHYVVGILGMDLESFDRLFIVESLDDMRQLHAAYQGGKGLSLSWYTSHEEIGVITTPDTNS